ncbi:MAG: multicopper oxidase domain-containing protein [Flavobacteriia bacterium]|nr:multicopper oxidase domain-containing protein [Flavobacteriia bacterium]
MVRIRLIKQPLFFTTLAILLFNSAFSQNPLNIPPVLTGLNFNLNVQAGTQPFYPGNPTPTYGINGAFLSPTIVVNKGDIVTLNVINTLNVATTMHWHGLHVAPENDGGPHQSIAAGSTWSPSFEILNNAGTYWYHPHGEGKTELHVGKGLSGLFIVHDPTELSLGLPQTYGVDDIPLIVQTKAFDVLHQIAIADHMDTAIFVNGTLHATTDLPAQVVRLRLLNGSSMRSFYFGFSNNMTFYQIATDGGLVATPNAVTRLLLAPGERSEVLVDLSGMNGQSVDLMSYASEMPVGVFGSPAVGVAPDTMEMYDENFLNGADFQLVEFNIVAQNASPITSIPATLVPYTPFDVADVDVNRMLIFDTITLVPGSVPSLAEGPFGINATTFNMDSINITIPLNSTEVWTLKNNTHIAHPFHIHDVQFNVIEKSGTTPPITEQGWKDVILHHEDDGMMGSFLVIDPFASLGENTNNNQLTAYPNPASGEWKITGNWNQSTVSIEIVNALGQLLFSQNYSDLKEGETIVLPNSGFESGVYFARIRPAIGVEQIMTLEKK